MIGKIFSLIFQEIVRSSSSCANTFSLYKVLFLCAVNRNVNYEKMLANFFACVLGYSLGFPTDGTCT